MVDKETIELASNLYKSLRKVTVDKKYRQHLEARLSEQIVNAELLIHEAKFSASFEQETTARVRRGILKRLADGLAWKCLTMDDLDLAVFPEPPPVGFMAGKAGYAAERKLLDAANSLDEIKFAIQNDCTNILRIGDITLLLKDGQMLPIEVKSSSRGMRGARAKRQMRRYKELLIYLSHGTQTEVSVAGEPRRGVVLNNPRQYYWNELDSLITKTQSRDHAFLTADDGVLLIGYPPDFAEHENLFSKALASARWKKPSIYFASLTRQLDPMDNDPLRFVVPLTAFEISVPAGLALVREEVEVVIFVNMDIIKSMLAREGLKLMIDSDDNLVVRSDRFGHIDRIEVHRAWLFVLYGLQTISSFVCQLLELLKKEVHS